MKRSWVSIVPLAVLAAFGSSTAQTLPDSPLKGLKQFRLTISLDDDARECGVGREQIEAALRPILSGSKLQLEDESRTQLGARANVSRVTDRVCAFAFTLEVVPFVTIAGTGVAVYAPVWSRQAIPAPDIRCGAARRRRVPARQPGPDCRLEQSQRLKLGVRGLLARSQFSASVVWQQFNVGFRSELKSIVVHGQSASR